MSLFSYKASRSFSLFVLCFGRADAAIVAVEKPPVYDIIVYIVWVIIIISFHNTFASVGCVDTSNYAGLS